ncbi:hypothetical protein KFL_002090210 [Klebsormidium nitens]|uniref:Uncharacterized protein n=1 Tax=Klebsormidium nitens TaxID=105231 RepID=A0A1Y1I631_KLENI|nr:hypothetical protein KFL_002090210 [Klebsormidium nitens]|eukprot:GAQ84869.1 hypothetical protein KFL_002090210 [Klebsormidium nitens]
MKLFIEVEISPEELPAAAELFKTLRTLTEHVKIRTPGAAPSHAVAAQPPPVPPPLQVPPQQTAPQAPPLQAPPPQNNLAQVWPLLIKKLSDANQLNQVASDITRLLQAGTDTDKSFKDFQQAFVNVVFDKELVMRQQSVVPYMYLVPRLPEPFKGKLRDDLIPRVLKHLTVKRPVDASRADFFAQAEAFAALVNMEFVSITGAVTTIITLLKKPENRCAAITMLGKTVELCLQQLTEKCEPESLNKLRAALLEVTEDAFHYDVEYIEESMGWTRQANGMPSGMPGENGAFADVVRDQLVSASRDGTLLVWSPEGQVVDTLAVGGHYACGMDINHATRTLVMCGVTKDGSVPVPPLVTLYEANARSWQETGSTLRSNSKLVSCIKALGDQSEHAFVTGETLHSPGVGGSTEVVCLYDVAHQRTKGAPFAAIQPVRQYAEHTNLVTCLSLFPPNPNVFFSGSRDCTVKVWDRRSDRSVGCFGEARPGGGVQAHSAMVTCVDALEPSAIVSSGMEGTVHRWDFRKLATQAGAGSPPVSTLHVDGSAIMKVALRDAHTAAVSTLRGLYTADIAAPAPQAHAATPFADKRRVGRYHDLRWGKDRKQLFAGGEDCRVDVYAVK